RQTHLPAKALQSPLRIRRNPGPRRRTPLETAFPADPVRPALVAARQENAEPHPTPSHAARSLLRRTRARSSSSAIVLRSARIPSDLIPNRARSLPVNTQTTGNDACREIMEP